MGVAMLATGMVVLALILRRDARLRHFMRSRVGDAMTLLSLILSVAAFVYLVYAMLRPEKF